PSMKLLISSASLAIVAYAGARLPTSGLAASKGDVIYLAELHAINTKATLSSAAGTVRFTVHGDSLTIRVRMHDVPAGIEHWQHFHGFPDGRQSTCPTSVSDTSHDQLVDIRETEPSAGT